MKRKYEKKKSNIQPNQPSDPRKEVVTEQKEPLQYLCLLEWECLICQLCCCQAAIYTLFSLIIPAKPAVQMRIKYLCWAMLDLKTSSPSSVICFSLFHGSLLSFHMHLQIDGCSRNVLAFCSIGSVEGLNLLQKYRCKDDEKHSGIYSMYICFLLQSSLQLSFSTREGRAT